MLAHDPALDWHGDREDAGRGSEPARPGDGHRPAVASPRLDRLPDRPCRGRAPVWARWRGRRLLVIGSALAVAAAACVVAVARPWAGGPADLPGDSVGLIGQDGGRVGTAVDVGNPAGLAYGDGSVWAVDSADGMLWRIDPATHAVVQQIPVGSAPSAVAITGPDVWVTNSGDGTVSRVSAAAGRAVDTIQVGNLPVAIAAGSGAVWVANEGDGTVDRIDPATGDVTKRGIQVGARPDGIAAGPGAVWVANGEDGTVQRIDPATGQPGGPVHVGSGPAGIAVTPGAVWVANSLDQTVSKIDPATGTVTGTIGVGDGPGGIVAAKDGVWVSDEFDATLRRIDPQTARVVRTVHLGSSPQGMVVAGSGVWVAARPFPAASHRGGTLTVVSDLPPVADPSAGVRPGRHSDDSPPSMTVSSPCAGRVVRQGSRSSPTWPLSCRARPTAARHTRSRSAGESVTPPALPCGRPTSAAASSASSSLAPRPLSRTTTKASSAHQRASQHPKRCDLSAGIVTNDATGMVTFRLAQADPDFLYKLALSVVAPAPPGTPDRAISRAPFLPGTGPYMISQFRPNKSVTLVRNPYFRQWSYAAQPAGYPSVIRYERMASQSRQESAVIAGRADLAILLSGGDQSLAVRYPARVHYGLKMNTQFVSLNTRQPPFTNIKARQAVNYAIDRARIIQLYHVRPRSGHRDVPDAPAGLPRPPGLLPLHGRRRGRGLARPGHGRRRDSW